MHRLDQDETNSAFERLLSGKPDSLSLNFAIANNAAANDPFLPEFQCALFLDEIYDTNRRWWLAARVVSREDVDELILFTRPQMSSDADSDDGVTAYLIDLPENNYLSEYRDASHDTLRLEFFKVSSWSESIENLTWSEHKGELQIPNLVFACLTNLLNVSDELIDWEADNQLYAYKAGTREYIEEMFGATEQAFCSAEFDEDFLDEIRQVSQCSLSHFF
jgi:hypothetical protein